MSRRIILAATLAFALLAATACGPDANSRLGPIGAGLDGPSQLSATVYARGLPHVAAFAFDPQGRLWAATAALTDSGTDGVYLITRAGSSPVAILSHMHTVLGLLWHDGELFVASRDNVSAYRDLVGDHFARHRTVIAFPSGVGEVNSMALAPDGRISLGITSPCDACAPKLADSAAVVSFEPDGSGLRVDVSHLRAPVGLAYYPGTGDLFVTMDQQDNLGKATPGDYLGVVKRGENWRFPTCYGQAGSACAGVPAPVAVLDKHAAVSDVAIVTGQLGAGGADSAIVAEWALGKVVRVELQRHGSSYVGTVSPFLTGITNPVAVALAPGRGLLVGDWDSGTIYRISAT